MNDRSRPLILICNDGFQSSLAAATLHRLGLVNATDLDGGASALCAAGLPVIPAE
jgi:rhodanese-related sulfurtransferase